MNEKINKFINNKFSARKNNFTLDNTYNAYTSLLEQILKTSYHPVNP